MVKNDLHIEEIDKNAKQTLEGKFQFQLTIFTDNGHTDHTFHYAFSFFFWSIPMSSPLRCGSQDKRGRETETGKTGSMAMISMTW